MPSAVESAATAPAAANKDPTDPAATPAPFSLLPTPLPLASCATFAAPLASSFFFRVAVVASAVAGAPSVIAGAASAVPGAVAVVAAAPAVPASRKVAETSAFGVAVRAVIDGGESATAAAAVTVVATPGAPAVPSALPPAASSPAPGPEAKSAGPDAAVPFIRLPAPSPPLVPLSESVPAAREATFPEIAVGTRAAQGIPAPLFCTAPSLFFLPLSPAPPAGELIAPTACPLPPGASIVFAPLLPSKPLPLRAAVPVLGPAVALFAGTGPLRASCG